jgi:hypothetical protein
VSKDKSRLVVVFALSALMGACASSSSGTGTAGGSGPGSAGMTGSAGSGSGAAGMSGTAGSPGGGGSTATGTAGNTTAGAAGTTGAAGNTASGAAGTAGNTTSGAAGTTGAGGTTAGAAGTTAGTAGRGGTTGSAGNTAGAAGTAGAVGTGGVAGTLGPGGAPPACQSPIPITMGTAATVTASLGTTVRASVSADLMGVHTSVYDANMQLATTPDLLKGAGVKSLRYPGGSYSDLYHWSLHTGTYTPAAGAGSNQIYVAPDTHFGAFLQFMERTGASAVITVNYGMNSLGNGGGEPKEAAAWVAYANGSPTSTVNIGADSKGTNWQTVAFWANLRGAAPLATDDGYNKFRISHPAPFNIKYWEVGNELYGNGWYYGGCGWEADMHVPYPASGTCTDRQNNPALSPATYGAGVKAYAQAMKAVDSTIKIGGIVVAHSATEYTNWNGMVLPQACGAGGMDFASVHWYPGNGVTTLPTIPEVEIKELFSRARAAVGTASYNCTGGANMPIAITEWGPNTLCTGCALPASTATAAPVGSQLVGLFAAESYAHFMEQGAMAVHWLELHNNSYLAGIDATNDPFTTVNDTPRWGYHGAQIASLLAGPGDRMVQAAQSGTFGSALKTHASVHANGDIAIMMTNTNRNVDANVTVNVTGGNMLGCVGKRYAYTPVNTDQDGTVSGDWIFSNNTGSSVPVLVPRYSSVVVVFPRR